MASPDFVYFDCFGLLPAGGCLVSPVFYTIHYVVLIFPAQPYCI